MTHGYFMIQSFTEQMLHYHQHLSLVNMIVI
jgi:hypothetical protein